MSAYTTDGMYGMPVINTNCLESIECSIAFDVRDWSEDKRSAWIYGIVFGWKDEKKEIQAKFNWSDEDIKRIEKYHEQWVKLKEEMQ